MTMMMMMVIMMMMMRMRGRWWWEEGDDVDVEEDEDDDVEEDDVEEEGRSQDREAHFVRACAIEVHTGISQEPFCMEIYRENSGRPGDHLD